jgi:glutathione S-transferase
MKNYEYREYPNPRRVRNLYARLPVVALDDGSHNRDGVAGGLEKLDHQLDGRPFVVGDVFSIADITAVCGVDLGKALGIEIPKDLVNVHRWYDLVSTRPSMAA